MELKVKRLDPAAMLPVVAHPGEDLGYDVFALEDVVLRPLFATPVRTGIAVEVRSALGTPLGLLLRDRSSMAAKGTIISGGVIDAGYRGEILVVMTLVADPFMPSYVIRAGDKIAQMVPIPVLTGWVQEVDELGSSKREHRGFGSSDSPQEES